jgi:hypothetical protein
MRTALMFFVLLFLLQSAATPQQQPAPADDAAWKKVEQAMGRPGQQQPDGVMKFGFPRSDLKVVVAGTNIKAGLALGSWVAFSSSGESMVMGDLVLLEDEVAPVMAKLQENGIDVTALHNHLLHESPRVMYMHINGHGSAATLAKEIASALSLTKTPGPSSPNAQARPAELGIDTSAIESALGHKGKVNGGILQFSVPRAETITEAGSKVPNSMGIATGINFQPTGQNRAAIAGDFVLAATEVNPVMKALRANGIEVTAVHSHMLQETPKLYFMHFWANDDALKLAKGLRAALDLTNSMK